MVDDLDRILVSEPVVSPSGDFASRVMRAVRQSYDQLAPMSFPWQGLAAGLIGGLVCTATTIMILMSGSGLSHTVFDATAWLQTFPRGMNPNLLSMFVAIVVSLLVIRLSVAYTNE